MLTNIKKLQIRVENKTSFEIDLNINVAMQEKIFGSRVTTPSINIFSHKVHCAKIYNREVELDGSESNNIQIEINYLNSDHTTEIFKIKERISSSPKNEYIHDGTRFQALKNVSFNGSTVKYEFIIGQSV